MPATDYLDELKYDWAFQGASFPTPPTLYVALYTVSPTKAGGGTEVTGGSYGRITTAAADWNVGSGSPRQVLNATVLKFPVATGSWGSVVAFGLLDASSGGNLLWYGSVGPISPIAGDPVVFNISDLVIQGA